MQLSLVQPGLASPLGHGKILTHPNEAFIVNVSQQLDPSQKKTAKILSLTCCKNAMAQPKGRRSSSDWSSHSNGPQIFVTPKLKPIPCSRTTPGNQPLELTQGSLFRE